MTFLKISIVDYYSYFEVGFLLSTPFSCYLPKTAIIPHFDLFSQKSAIQTFIITEFAHVTPWWNWIKVSFGANFTHSLVPWTRKYFALETLSLKIKGCSCSENQICPKGYWEIQIDHRCWCLSLYLSVFSLLQTTDYQYFQTYLKLIIIIINWFNSAV